MKAKRLSTSLFVALFVVFMDFMGFAIIWPIFSPMLFDTALPLLPSDASQEARGFWLGLLLSLAPLSQFFSSAIWGTVSDNCGRRRPLQCSLIVTCIGTFCAFIGVHFYNLWIILLSRIIIGCASGNISIVQATIADISAPEEKTKNFGLFSMMIGLGYTIGPLLGGSFHSYSYPFIIAAVLAILNLIFAYVFFKETLHCPIKTKINWKSGLLNLKRAFHLEGLRLIFLTCFLANFAWTFFLEFIPVYLIDQHHFSANDLGVFFGVASAIYALNSGVLIRLVSKWFKAETLIFGGMFLAGLAILAILLNTSLVWMWIMIVLKFSFLAYASPSFSTLISNGTSSQIQGEALGILGSVYGMATITSSLFSGSLVGAYPTLPIWGGGIIMLVTGIIFFIYYPKFLLRQKILNLVSRSR